MGSIDDLLCNTTEEDYIDMEVSSSFCCYSIDSPPQTREFEFQMSSNSNEKESITSPADELFYKGKLLPLHLPPRLQMVQKLLQNSTIPSSIITTSTTPSSTYNNTPLDSCNISPSESCRVSSELNPDEYFFDWSTEISSFIGDHHQKKSWCKKLKLIKQSSLSQKLKASRAYLKSLFSKSVCSDESCATAACNIESESVTIGKECLNKYIKVLKRNPFGFIDNDRYQVSAFAMKTINKEMGEDGAVNSHRRSFSGAIKRHSARKCSSNSTSSSGSSSSSSSLSFNLNGLYDLQLLKRSCSANSDLESSIEGAIAHCKKSQ